MRVLLVLTIPGLIYGFLTCTALGLFILNIFLGHH